MKMLSSMAVVLMLIHQLKPRARFCKIHNCLRLSLTHKRLYPILRSPLFSKVSVCLISTWLKKSRKVIRDGDLFTNLTMVVRSDTSKPQVNAITDDELLGVKKSELPAPIKRSTSPAVIKDEPEGRRVVRRIGAIGSATLEKHAIESDKDKYLREFEKAELEKAFGKEPLLPRLSREEMSNIRQIIEFNREKLLRAEQQLSTLQSSQSDVMKNLRRASVGEQYRLDKSLEQNIRLQNDLTSEIKNLKKLIRDDELTLDEQFEQERKIREINRKKAAAAKAVESRAIPVKVVSPPPEKQDRKYRRAMEDKMMGKQVAASSEAKAAEGLSKLPVSKPGTMTVQYYDPGTHWCKSCNFVAFKMYGYLEHLQSSSHMKRRHKIGKPWQPEEVIKPPRKSLVSRQETVVQPIKGVEFIHPVDSFYCLLCNFFTGDKDSIEYHLKSTEHHKQYETYITDNPMYEKRYKLDKERGLQEAKKLEEKRQEEQERQREAEREELERRREVERKRERELKEAEEKRKKAKLELLKARKKAEVLAITRGNQDDSDIEEVDTEEGPVEPSANETSQERIKRSLLEKTRAKKTVKSSTEEPGVVEGETAVQRSIRLAKEAKSMQDRVRAKAAEIEQSVYGPKESNSLGPPGVFLPEQTDAAKAKLSVTSSSSLAPSSTKTASTTAPPSTTASSISPFVQKMMQMEKSGEIITTASVKAQQAATAPQMLPNNQSYRPMQQGLMAMGPMPAPMGSAAMGPASMGPDPMGPAPVRPVSMGSAPVRPASMGSAPMGPAAMGPVSMGSAPMGPAAMGPVSMGSAPMGPDSRGPSPMGPMRPRMAMQPAAHPVAMNVMGPRRPSPMRVMNRSTMPQQPMMGSMGPPRVPNRMMGPIANNWRNSMQTGPVAAHMMRPGMAPRCNRAPTMPQNKPIPQAAKSEEDSRELRPPGTDEQVDVPPGTERQVDVPPGADRPVNAPQGTDRQIDVPSGTDKPVNVPPVSDRQMDVPSGTDRPVNVPPVTDRQIDVPSGTDRQVDVPPGTDRQDCTKFTEQEGSSVKSHSCASSAASIVKPSHARQLQSPAENSSPSNSKIGEAIPEQSSNSVKIRAADNSDADTSDAGGTAVDSSAVDSTAVDSTAVDSTAVDSTAVDSTAVDSTAVDSTAVGSTAVGSTAADSNAILEPSNITAQPMATSADADAGFEMKSSIESAPEGAAESTSANDYGNMTRSPLAVEEMRQEDSQQNEIELESVEDMTFTVIDSVGDEDEKA
ncbi:zinc finger protein 318-like isoform X2 [Watersipora subatra]|uniref:zinc finger protein 318-like isoform X2 n=1 Tax=Watersipora subatra TaxID=2589382 RepID=UPI00355B8394